jgi:uncharacterized protein with ParB-like and HNH nuclease domain
MWDKSHWQKFWDDAEEHVENDETWFLGSIITLRNESKGRVSSHDVIDGQQRLTTIFIYRMVIYHILDKISTNIGTSHPDLDFDYWKKYLMNVSDKDRLVHINDFVTVAPQQTRLIQLYEVFVAKKNTASLYKRTRYYNAFEFFRKKFNAMMENLDTTQKFEMLIKYITVVNSARIIWAQVDSLPHAMTMFEVLNNRGKPLNATDIIKTSFLKQIVTLEIKGIVNEEDRLAVHRNVIQSTGDFWKHINKLLLIDGDDEVSLKRFLRHFYILYLPNVNNEANYKTITEKQVMRDYDVLLKLVEQRSSMKQLQQDLIEYAIYYGFLRDPLNGNMSIPQHMEQNNRFFIKFLQNRSTTHKEFYISHMLSDINKLGLVQINLLNLYIFSTFMNDINNDNDYNQRVNMLHLLLSNVLRFVIRRNLTDVPRPNQTDPKLTELMNEVEGRTPSNAVKRIFSNLMALSPLDKLKAINDKVRGYIELSSSSLTENVKLLQYSESGNLDVRFILHFMEKWTVDTLNNPAVGAFVLRDYANPFDGFRRTAATKNTPEYEIEHIMPKSLVNDFDDDEEITKESSAVNINRWKEDLMKWNSSILSRNIDEQHRIVNSLGNLTLLSHNSQASNLPFQDKQNLSSNNGVVIGYKASSPQLLNTIRVSQADISVTLQNSTQWTEHEINERTKQMHIILNHLLGDIQIEVN